MQIILYLCTLLHFIGIHHVSIMAEESIWLDTTISVKNYYCLLNKSLHEMTF